MAWNLRGNGVGPTGPTGGSDMELPPVVAVSKIPAASRWYQFPSYGLTSGGTMSTTAIVAMPFAVQSTILPVAIGVWCNGVTSGSTIRGALYNVDSGLEPSTHLFDLGAVATGANLVRFPNITSLSAGWYALAVTSYGTGAAMITRNGTSGAMVPHIGVGATPPGSSPGSAFERLYTLGSGGSWPSPFAVTGTISPGFRFDVIT